MARVRRKVSKNIPDSVNGCGVDAFAPTKRQRDMEEARRQGWEAGYKTGLDSGRAEGRTRAVKLELVKSLTLAIQSTGQALGAVTGIIGDINPLIPPDR